MDLPIRSTWHPSERRRIALDAPPDKRLAAFLLPRCARPGNQRRLAYWGRANKPAMYGLKSPCLRARKGIAMSRYTGPRLRKVRRLGVALPGPRTKTPCATHQNSGRAAALVNPAITLRLKETQTPLPLWPRERQLRHVIRRARSKQASDAKLCVA